VDNAIENERPAEPDTQHPGRAAVGGRVPVADGGLIELAGTLGERLRDSTTVARTGRVVRAVGTSLRVSGLSVQIGQRCEVHDRHSGVRVPCDVVGIDRGDAILFPLGGLEGIAVDSSVRVTASSANVMVGDTSLGRVLDGFGHPLDDGGALIGGRSMPLVANAPNPLSRRRVDTPLETGVRAIDTLLTVGIGQRLGIFAPAGVGKSTLLGMLGAFAEADVVVIALVGERGREVREFIEDTLDEPTRRKSVVVVATSDRPAMERIAAARTATAIAEGFRDDGRQVLLLLDSVTRYARALHEVGLASGEPAVRQGFTPSVFAELPRLFERSGNGAIGSVTAFYTVLTDDDDGLDPIAEESRSTLDGHIVLSRELAEQGHFPAIDVLASVSRLHPVLASKHEHQQSARCRTLLATYRDAEFLLRVGEYKSGSDADTDAAIDARPRLRGFLRQATDESVSRADALAALAVAIGETEAQSSRTSAGGAS